MRSMIFAYRVIVPFRYKAKARNYDAVMLVFITGVYGSVVLFFRIS